MTQEDLGRRYAADVDETRRVWSPSGEPVLPPPPGGWPAPRATATIQPTSPPSSDALPPGPDSGPVPVLPPHVSGGSRRGVLVAALVAAVAVGGGVATWFALGDGPGATATAGQTTTAAAADEGEDLGDAGSPAPVVPAAPTVSPEDQALADLQALREESLARVDLDGRWMAQVASKDVGITDPLQTAANGTHQFFAVDILAESRAALSSVADPADLYVLWSTDFGATSTAPDGDPYWVTLVDGGFAGEGAVDAWCAGAYPQLSAEQLANTCVGRPLTPPHA
ncbi:hypothetical protein LY71_12514 [Geodermatophilus tzadiensis]|uniref:Uncharacterized protein n=1 Tax=Geodermatophilus tzadiensis TaxID=1137988 RepID=A0A2T0STA2_9ACTN|nr:hypothetical protein [Geodermatophilus tzadiensis]PRY36593.1 hypothetical protein LY71_12514 [Geodermatophilus tzadiensis]